MVKIVPALYVSPNIQNRILIFDEVVLLWINSIEKNFQCEPLSNGTWMITVELCYEGLDGERLKTNYIFGEEMEVVGTINKAPEYGMLINRTPWPSKQVLVLKRKL